MLCPSRCSSPVDIAEYRTAVCTYVEFQSLIIDCYGSSMGPEHE
jgi:hypothetical protein